MEPLEEGKNCAVMTRNLLNQGEKSVWKRKRGIGDIKKLWEEFLATAFFQTYLYKSFVQRITIIYSNQTSRVLRLF